MRKIIFTLAFIPCVLVADQLSLDQALEMASSYSFRLKQAELDQDVAWGGEIQAGAIPNPIFSVDYGTVGDIGGNCNDEASITYELEQLVELGGKRAARQCLAEVESQKADLAYNLITERLYAEVMESYYRVSIWRELAQDARRLEAIAQDLIQKGEDKVTAGTLSLIEFNDHFKDIRPYQFIGDEKELLLRDAESNLELLLGCIELHCYSFDAIPEFHALPQLEPCLEVQNLPASQFEALNVLAAERLYRLENANAVPDVSVRVEVEQERFRHAGVSVGASIPLPFFDRNEGNRTKAWALWRKAEVEWRHFLCRYQREIHAAYRKGIVKFEQVLKIEKGYYLSSKERFHQFQEKFKEGRASSEEMLHAELIYLDAKGNYLETLQDYLSAFLEYKRLTSSICNE